MRDVDTSGQSSDVVEIPLIPRLLDFSTATIVVLLQREVKVDGQVNTLAKRELRPRAKEIQIEVTKEMSVRDLKVEVRLCRSGLTQADYDRS